MAILNPVNTLDAGATLVGGEGSSYTIPAGRTATCWYGNTTAGNGLTHITGMSGTVTFNNSTFGDPASGFSKSGWYLLDPVVSSGGSLSCSVTADPAYSPFVGGNEYGSYTVPAGRTASAWFGSPTSFLTLTGQAAGTTIDFTAGGFGGSDPAPGITKLGWILLDNAPAVTTEALNLTTGGADTYAIWNGATTTGVPDARKATGASDTKISNIIQSLTKTGVALGSLAYANRTITWSDGTPSGSGTASSGLQQTNTYPEGIDLNLLANTAPVTVKVYVNVSGDFNTSAGTQPKCRYVARMSDGSVAPIFGSFGKTDPISGSYNYTLTFSYQAASACLMQLQLLVPAGGVLNVQAVTFSGGSSGAALAGTPADVVTATGALSAAIKMNAAAVDVATAAGGILSGILFAGNAQDVASASGGITAKINLNGVALDVATASGPFTTQINLAGAAVDIVTSTVGITAKISLAGNALDQALASAGFAGGAAALAGVASDTVVALANISTGIQLAGAATDVVLATGPITSQIVLTAGAIVNSLATGSLNLQLLLAGAAADISTAQAAITSAIILTGAALDSVTATGALTAPTAGLSGAALDISTANGQLTAQINLNGNALNQALANAGLTTNNGGLAANAVDSVTSIASLNTQILVAGSAFDIASATGNLTNPKPLSGSALDQALATGVLTVSSVFSAAAIANALAAGSLSTLIRLGAIATAQASANAVLTQVAKFIPYGFDCLVSQYTKFKSGVGRVY